MALQKREMKKAVNLPCSEGCTVWLSTLQPFCPLEMYGPSEPSLTTDVTVGLDLFLKSFSKIIQFPVYCTE